MNIKKIIPIILFFTLTACSDTPQKDAEVKETTQQVTSDLKAEADKNDAEEATNTVATAEPSVADAVAEDNLGRKKEKADLFRPLESNARALNEPAEVASAPGKGVLMEKVSTRAMPTANMAPPPPAPTPAWNTESYNAVTENGFISTSNDPLSTFSIDVDTASYSNVRRFINEGNLPPKGAVRIEELINYFSYDYKEPDNEHPFSVTTEVGPSPWNDSRKLVRIGLKAKDIDKKDLPPSNLVFLIDVSGSMSAPNKLPLLQTSLKMLVRQLGDNDRISLVVYAGNDHVVLSPT
ncbi:MAG: VWA domain-containing protein, partial [Candidatus Electrothrix sp. MAN1_4]|nr:VWA domain-containing protein [Candidatus Electrothrix sp. MAN1_4]